MSAALPPVTDCGCRSASSSVTPPSGGGCCALVGTTDPNEAGLVPDDPTQWIDYWQLADLVNGPVIQTWYWNPNVQNWS